MNIFSYHILVQTFIELHDYMGFYESDNFSLLNVIDFSDITLIL